VFGASTITALTAQNTVGVRRVNAVPADFVVAQVEAVLDDLPVAATKTGGLATVDVVRAVGDLASPGRLPLLVVDPVMVATSGDRLLEARAEELYRSVLFPLAVVVTPNLRESEELLRQDISTLAQQPEAARALGELGCRTIVVKGGHQISGAEHQAVDVVWDGTTTYELRTPPVTTRNNHGSGCTFASAIAAGWPAAGACRTRCKPPSPTSPPPSPRRPSGSLAPATDPWTTCGNSTTELFLTNRLNERGETRDGLWLPD